MLAAHTQQRRVAGCPRRGMPDGSDESHLIRPVKATIQPLSPCSDAPIERVVSISGILFAVCR